MKKELILRASPGLESPIQSWKPTGKGGSIEYQLEDCDLMTSVFLMTSDEMTTKIKYMAYHKREKSLDKLVDKFTAIIDVEDHMDVQMDQ